MQEAPPSPAGSHQHVPPSFMIPSIHDETELECRIYHPKDKGSQRAAVIAHPYGPLSGCFDDRMVQTLVATLVSEGYIVGTFNFRGAGASKGHTSWTSKPEVADYTSFVGFFVLYLGYFQPNLQHSMGSVVQDEGSQPKPKLQPHQEALSLILGGYSYGAMITMALPPMSEVIDRFLDVSAKSIKDRIEKEAYRQAERQKTNVASKCDSIETIRSSALSVSYLLVSPLLPPLSWAIAMPLPSFSFKSHHGQESSLVATSEGQSNRKLYECPTLAIYSDNDQFTAVKKLRKWSADNKDHEKSRFHCVEIPGAGHFWLREGAAAAVQRGVKDWLRT